MPEASEGRDDVLDHAVRKVVLLRVAAEICERKHGNRRPVVNAFRWSGGRCRQQGGGLRRGLRRLAPLLRSQRLDQRNGLCLGFHGQVLPQCSPTRLELSQSHVFMASMGVDADQCAMGSLRRRICRKQPFRECFAGSLSTRATRGRDQTKMLHQLQRLALVSTSIGLEPVLQSFRNRFAGKQVPTIKIAARARSAAWPASIIRSKSQISVSSGPAISSTFS